MKRWGEQKPLRLDEKEMRTDLGSGNFIFVGSSTDMFANDVPDKWIEIVLEKCSQSTSRFLFQSKNPERFMKFSGLFPYKSVVCTTIETNRVYKEIMNNCPAPMERAYWLTKIGKPCYVTIEPIIDFDINRMVALIRMCEPVQVNIGADSGHNNLPEPSIDKLLQLIEELETFTTINRKSNLQRILR